MPAFLGPTITKVETTEERAPHPDVRQEPTEVSKLRLLAFYGAVLTAMYLVALAFTPRASVAQDMGMALAFTCAAVAIAKLGSWHLSAKRSKLFGLVGVALLITAAVAFAAPVQSDSISGVDATCGSSIMGRSFGNVWSPLSATAIDANCHETRRERLSIAVMQLELGLGALYLGREYFWVRRRLLRVGFVLVLVGLVGSFGWTRAAVVNADAHNDAFAPWFATYGPEFGQLTAANQELRIALVAGDSGAINAACAQLVAVNDRLAPSVGTWPLPYAKQRTQWQQFLTKHHDDAAACVRTSQASGSTEALRESEWFSQSSQGLDELRPVLDYR